MLDTLSSRDTGRSRFETLVVLLALAMLSLKRSLQVGGGHMVVWPKTCFSSRRERIMKKVNSLQSSYLIVTADQHAQLCKVEPWHWLLVVTL